MDILTAIWTVTYGVLLVILGFNALIIVHEFGHFIVARLCGVRCEKFYIWFDFWGLKLFKFKWGDTEYGVGLFPLGGYLKMLGQEDNPGAIQAEIERAKETADGRRQTAADEKPSIFAPDSYLSKSVPQRLAIIVAGVVMNFLFAIVCAAGAYMIGVREMTPAVGNVIPGSPAWEAGLQAGDRITKIDDKEARAFGDLLGKMIDGDKSVQLTIDRQGETMTIPVAPRKRSGDLTPTIGVMSTATLELLTWEVVKQWEKYFSAKSLETLKELGKDLEDPSRQNSYSLDSVDGQAIGSYTEYQDAQFKKIGLPITCSFSGTDVEIPAIPMRTIPVRFEMGEIVSVLPDSDAAKQGIKPGDTIVSVDGDAAIDPLKLPQILLRKVNDEQKTVELVVKKGSAEEGKEREQTLTVELKPVRILPVLGGMSMRDPLGSSALGVSWNVEPVIAEFYGDTNGVNPGDKVTGVEFVNCANLFDRPTSFSSVTREGGFFLNCIGSKIDIPYIFTYLLQGAHPSKPGFWARIMIAWGFKEPEREDKELSVRLTLERSDGTVKVVNLPIVEADDWFQTERGFGLKAEQTIFKAEGFGEALSRGTGKTIYYSLLVYRSVNALVNGTVSMKALNGPVGIVTIIYQVALEDWSVFLMLLCLIGANLAVINLFPIPPLDGGHVIFLVYEWIFRRPPNEMVQVILSYFGLFLIILLMLWTVSLDLWWIPRW